MKIKNGLVSEFTFEMFVRPDGKPVLELAFAHEDGVSQMKEILLVAGYDFREKHARSLELSPAPVGIRMVFTDQFSGSGELKFDKDDFAFSFLTKNRVTKILGEGPVQTKIGAICMRHPAAELIR